MYSDLPQWQRLRRHVLVECQSIRSVAKREGMSRITLRKVLTFEKPPRYGNRQSPAPKPSRPEVSIKLAHREAERTRWLEWLYLLERGDFAAEALGASLAGASCTSRKIVVAAMAKEVGFSDHAIAQHLGLARGTVRTHLAAFAAGDVDTLLQRKLRPHKADDDDFKKALFGLLHEPPSLSGYNRTSWRLEDLQKALAKRGKPACRDVIRQAIRKAGFRWKAAKVVLTSTDPEYREKLAHVQDVLSNLGDDERFFSVDEYGPFAVKAKAGRLLAGPDEHPSVAQWQKSKGWLILTAAVELSRNRVTHFYSRAKNTTEMIRMATMLLEEYAGMRTLYLSWDAASWHLSKQLHNFIEKSNGRGDGEPRIELVPLPASAQFLNVIESVFSGMARAIIHNSDYASVDEVKAAIDRYFRERNEHFERHPKRAGRAIWGKERVPAEFDAANNSKDPRYQ